METYYNSIREREVMIIRDSLKEIFSRNRGFYRC